MYKLAALFCCSALLWSAEASGNQPVTVQLTSGRTYTALVDGRTGDERLWLRFEGPSAQLLRPILWDQIVRATHEGREITRQQLQALAEQIKSTVELPRMPVPPAGRSQAELAREALGMVRPVRSISIDVSLANWDSDAASDGLLLWVTPQDEVGELVASDALVEVTLEAPHQRKFIDSPQGRGERVDQVERWVMQATAEQLANQRPLKLEFRRQEIENDGRWASFGMLHVRVSVPGQGVFEAQRDSVQIRPFAPTRDLLRRNGWAPW